jgi:hypothetical protein
MGKRELISDVWIRFSEFQEWAREQNWLCYNIETYTDNEVHFYLLPNGETCSVIKIIETGVVDGFITE